MTYADVIIDISHEKLDRTFSYRVPETMEEAVRVGTPVAVPFGKANSHRTGFVVALSDTTVYAPDKVKDILGVVTDALPLEAELVALAAWMKQQYGGTMHQALRTVLPIKKKTAPKEAKLVHLALPEPVAREELVQLMRRAGHAVAKERLLHELIERRHIPWEVIIKKLDVPSVHIRDFEKKGWVTITKERDYRTPMKELASRNTDIRLNDDQKRALAVFGERKSEGRPYLLYGVTGSGKTEVYMEMIADTIAEGKQAIVLIPEIALTYQTVMRFYGRFGKKVSVMNSRLSAGERYDAFEQAKAGDVSIMVGPRSALFTPFPNLGIIIIDEEHESTYKSEQIPKYHATEVAIERARRAGAAVVLGSATPSLQSFYHAKRGEYILLTLPGRATTQTLPRIHVVNLREELAAGNRRMISRLLAAKLRDRLDHGEQSMLFMNRRGFAGFVSCRACGHVLKCPHCDVSLSLHKDGRLKCHYCGYEERKPTVCPACGSKYIGTFQAGTEQLEDAVSKLFPDARVLRMDADTTRAKDGHEKILSAFANREADILIGTQMIVKGHDFSHVTLMGIVAADMSLFAADYKSAERTFDLLCQAAGRAGRGERAGEVVMQTYRPEHYVIQTAAAQDYEAFYEQEMAYRGLLHYPPAGHMLLIQILSEREDLAERAGTYLYGQITGMKQRVQVAHPVEANVSKIKDVYRRAIYIKSTSYDALIAIKDTIEEQLLADTTWRNVAVRFDFDPMFGF